MPRHEHRFYKLDNDPLWYKDVIIYEVHVRAFYDSDGDGIGDFTGLIEKLDYLEDLGVTALWLLPFYPSPLRDDGYDISDYTSIQPVYGTMAGFKTFVEEAHRHGIRVITELVLNHTSDQHPWFQESRRPGSAKRDWYVWSDNDQKYLDARVIFVDTETSNWTWDPEAQAFYWHRFFSHQPDLNYDNPEVQDVMLEVIRFWLDMGLDGFRLDAVPYMFEREGTSCENLPETHEFLKRIRKEVDDKYPNRVLLAEDGVSGWEMIQAHRPALVLLDLRLKGEQGLELAREIRTDQRLNGVPIVAMTAHAQREDRERCLAMGMNHYVTKPIDLGELVTVIESYEKGLPNVKSGVMSFLRPAKEKNKKRDSEKSMENDGKNIYTSVQNESSILLEELEEAISAQDHDRLERTAEELKLLAEKVGAVNVRDEAFLLKMAARRKTLDRAHTQISNVREELTRFMDEATMILESGKKES